MLLSPLYMQAQNVSQKFNDSLRIYRSPMYWDAQLQKFCSESRRRHTWPWYFVNFGLIGCFAIPCLIYFFLNRLFNRELLTMEELMVGGFQLCVLFGLLCSAVIRVQHGSDFISFLNGIIMFERKLSLKYSRKGVIPPQKFSKARIGSLPMWLENGELDIIGIFALFLVLSFCSIPWVIPWIGLWFRFDFMALAFPYFFHPSLSLSQKIPFHVTRVLITNWIIMEGANTYRLLGLSGPLIYEGILSCHVFFLSQPVGVTVLRELRQLLLYFSVIRDLLASMSVTQLGTLYAFLLDSFTIAIAMSHITPWYIRLFNGLIEFIIVTALVIVLNLITAIDVKSSELHEKWKYSSRFMSTPSFHKRMLLKTTKSMKPISIPNGSLGTISRAMKADFFYSLSINSTNCVLGARQVIKRRF